MKLIYRGEQEKMIGELATKLGYSPTDLVYHLIKDLHELIIKEQDADKQESYDAEVN